MANTFLEVKEIARQALPRLIENLVIPNLVHRDYSNDFVQGKGATILVRKPNALVAKDFTGEIETQDIAEDSVEVTLNKLATVDGFSRSLGLTAIVKDKNGHRAWTNPIILR